MQFAFDLISDLHVDTWPEQFDWAGQATSPVCVVAGDIAKDYRLVKLVLKNLSECYAAVFYIDGNDEHKHSLSDLGHSYKQLHQVISSLDNVTYLQDNVVVIDGVAFIGTNGWWDFEGNPDIPSHESKQWMKEQIEQKFPDIEINPQNFQDLARTDAAYIASTVQKLQTHRDVKKIVVVTHTVPNPDLIKHDIDLENTHLFNCMTNSCMPMIHIGDTENKLHTWCFGHYHGSVDQTINGIRYVNNCRGRGTGLHHQTVYYPKRITVDF